MPNTLQTFLTSVTQKAADELIKAYLNLPEDKRAWKPEETSRSAVDQIAEVALLNGGTIHLIHTRKLENMDLEAFFREKEKTVALDWEQLRALLLENTQKFVAAIGEVPDDALDAEVVLPWGSQTLAEVLSYPYWNMSYHLGQINYIASLLGCLQ